MSKTPRWWHTSDQPALIRRANPAVGRYLDEDVLVRLTAAGPGGRELDPLPAGYRDTPIYRQLVADSGFDPAAGRR